ncbi:uncharacterized protein LOC133179717 [Saccostrea echinata]|uniref:uncharacterized protein LOC133179717 n=1 Tax=Saccostrea echinata TaxID=191078 RepID=UPI002A7EF7C1|nr:uncharacterized protein LOC133179717 [Saccostrea echinata]
MESAIGENGLSLDDNTKHRTSGQEVKNNVDSVSKGTNKSVELEKKEDNSLQTPDQCKQNSEDGDSEKKENKVFRRATTGKRSNSEMYQKSKDSQLLSPHVLLKRVKMTSLLKPAPIQVEDGCVQGTTSELEETLPIPAPSVQVKDSGSQSSPNKGKETLLKPAPTTPAEDSCSHAPSDKEEEKLSKPGTSIQENDRCSQGPPSNQGETVPKPSPSIQVNDSGSRGPPSNQGETVPKPSPSIQVNDSGSRDPPSEQGDLETLPKPSTSIQVNDSGSRGPPSKQGDSETHPKPATVQDEDSGCQETPSKDGETSTCVKDDKIIALEELKVSNKVNRMSKRGKEVTESEIERMLEDFSSNLGEESRETSYTVSEFSELQKTKLKYGTNASNLIRSIRRTIFQAVKCCKKLNEIAYDIGDYYLGMVVVWERNSSIKTVGNKALLKKVAKVLSPPCCNHGDKCVSTSSQADEGHSSQNFAESGSEENCLSVEDNTKHKTSEPEVGNNVDNVSKGTDNSVGLVGKEKEENSLQTPDQCKQNNKDGDSEKKENENKVSGKDTTRKRSNSEKYRKSELSPHVLLKRVKMTSLLKPAPIQVENSCVQGTPGGLEETLPKPAPSVQVKDGSQSSPNKGEETLLKPAPTVQDKDACSQGLPNKRGETLPKPAPTVQDKDNCSQGLPNKWGEILPKPANVQVNDSCSQGTLSKQGETLPQQAFSIQVKNNLFQNKQGDTLTCVKDGKIISLEELKKQVELALNSPNAKAPKFYLQKSPSSVRGKTTENFNKAIISSSKESEKVISVQTRTLPLLTQTLPLQTQRFPLQTQRFPLKQPIVPVALRTVANINTPQLGKNTGNKSVIPPSAVSFGGHSQVLPVSVFINHHTGEIITTPIKIGSLAAESDTTNSTQFNNVSELAAAKAQFNNVSELPAANTQKESIQFSNVSDLPAAHARKNSTQFNNVSDLAAANAQNSRELECVSDSVTESCSSEEDELKYSIILQKETDTGEYKMYKVPISNTDVQTQEDILPEQESDEGVVVKCEPIEESSQITLQSHNQSGVIALHSQEQSGINASHSQSQSGMTSLHSQNQSGISPRETSEMDGGNIIVKSEPEELSISSHHMNTNINKYKNPERKDRPITKGQTPKIVECPYEYALLMDSVPKKKKDHTVTFSHNCKTCWKSFKYASSLEVHERMHAVEKVKQHRCYICGRTCAVARSLEIHMRTHKEPTDKSENTFKCFKCDESFFHQESFQVHMRMHVHKYLSYCTKCGEGFHHQHLQRHMRIHEGQREKNESVNTASATNQPTTILTDQGTPEEDVEYKRKRQKRRVIVDDYNRGLIPTEIMKRQFRDTSDITGHIEYAPPTKKLMHLKERGDWERLLSCPGRPSVSQTASKSFSRNLITQTIDLGEAPDPDNLDLEAFDSPMEQQGTSLEVTSIKQEPTDNQIEFTATIQTEQPSNDQAELTTTIQTGQRETESPISLKLEPLPYSESDPS